jgi:hypothetical protein
MRDMDLRPSLGIVCNDLLYHIPSGEAGELLARILQHVGFGKLSVYIDDAIAKRKLGIVFQDERWTWPAADSTASRWSTHSSCRGVLDIDLWDISTVLAAAKLAADVDLR